MPEDERIKQIRQRVQELKLRDLQDEINRLSTQKQLLQKEKDLKLQAVSQKIQNLPAQFAAAHPVIAKVAQGVAQGTYQVGRAGIEFAKKQYEEGEARRQFMIDHPVIAKRIREEEYLSNPLNRLGVPTSPQPAPTRASKPAYTPLLYRLGQERASPSPIDRILTTKPLSKEVLSRKAVKHAIKHKAKPKAAKPKAKSLEQLKAEVQRLKLAKQEKKLRKELAEA